MDRSLLGPRVVRFADNYCAFTETPERAEEAFWHISEAMNGVRLRPNMDKSRIRRHANAEDLFLTVVVKSN
ncbi:hypothetical protein [Saccharopolyspora phatthalungensis]|uniref:Reverse transcriptase domain-containing protein n=1 Tax=Saccharopolyspora phatthalungensis TaxID=664693 RepID=A0A840Q8A8_9PSEU|nr:hypothetical protein [Saccharopolyspora phatthalungensis]MBB5156080.1 hypothetical protein [Saccharopolyspora phatthalungensis]